MEAGVFTELYVEPGVPHAHETLERTPQADRFFALRDNATARMLGAEQASTDSDSEEEITGILKYLFGQQTEILPIWNTGSGLSLTI